MVTESTALFYSMDLGNITVRYLSFVPSFEGTAFIHSCTDFISWKIFFAQGDVFSVVIQSEKVAG